MTIHAEITAAGQDPAVRPPALDIRDTRWGFVATERPSRVGMGQVREFGLKLATAAFLAAGAGQWLLPGSLFSGDVIVMKLVLTAALGGAAFAIFRFADRGFVAELHVDAALREVRVGTRNLRGLSHTRNRIAMHDIEECFARPSPREEGLMEICFRVAGHAEPVRIAAGSVTDLAPFLERLTRDLRTPREGIYMRMAG
jgi:hypothetical protein